MRCVTYLPENDAGVGVLDDGREAVGVELGCEGGGLLLLAGPDFEFVGKGELFEDDDDFPGVWPGWDDISLSSPDTAICEGGTTVGMQHDGLHSEDFRMVT